MKDYQGPPSTSLRNDDLARPFGTTNRTLPPGLGAVVSDGSASPGVDGAWSLAGRLRVEAEIIGQLTVLAVITKPVSAAGDAATLVDAIGEMGAAGAIFLTDVDADRHGRPNVRWPMGAGRWFSPAPQQGTSGPTTTATPI